MVSAARRFATSSVTILGSKDPNRIRFDSIFNAELTRQNIQGKGAIYFSQSGKTVCTASDTLFKEKAVLVDRLTFRLDHNPDNLCIIEGYVKFPTGWLLAKTKAIPYILFAWVLSIFLSTRIKFSLIVPFINIGCEAQ